ncbi:glycosyltransferase family 2 protein [Pedobacter antarcticus]|uniref:glycosyltransferase family 2 protein n=1 Tax=Pedobacter antarcticus TaxID=34086 RepID=UPI001C594B79|nr:glycosyltransferase family 2 protein [Pedobacter antarcticus]
MVSEPLVSVIIPVYNAENTLHIALESLKKQTYPQLEIIIVNDSSTDNTLNVIEGYIPVFENKGMRIKVISHEQNRGVATTRNTAIEHVTGEFIYFLDADDRIESNAIELLVEEAILKNADIVGCNWFLTFEKNERKMNQPSFNEPKEAIQKMLNGTMRWNLWLFMVRKSLYINHQIRFIPGMNMGEDLTVMIKLFVHASSVTYLNKALYHYGQSNDQSLTKIYSDVHILEVSTNVKEVEQYLFIHGFLDQLGNSMDFLKLNIKLPLLISDDEERYRTWLDWFPESNDKVMINKALPFRTRFIQWLAVREQFWAIKLYYRIVISFIYGRVYR